MVCRTGYPYAVLVLPTDGAARLRQATEDSGEAAEEATGEKPLPPHPPITFGGVCFLKATGNQLQNHP